MSDIEYRLDTYCRIMNPNIHDMEVRGIEFDLSTVIMLLAPTEGKVCLSVRFSKVQRTSFYTDVVQNVIYDGYVFSQINETFPLCVTAKRKLRMDRCLYTNEKIFFLEPAAGIEFAIIAEDVKFQAG